MTRLTRTQLVVLSAACQREDRRVLPLPEHLKGRAGAKVIASLAAKGLVEEVPAGSGDPVWREDGSGGRLTLVATNAAFDALGIEPKDGGRAEQAEASEDRAERAEGIADADEPNGPTAQGGEPHNAAKAGNGGAGAHNAGGEPTGAESAATAAPTATAHRHAEATRRRHHR
jgi:hypothetical protein